jgi:hypothetical protein
MRRVFSAFGLTLVLAACAAAPQTATTSRSWHTEDGTTRDVILTVYDSESASLFTSGPARSVPHWGELDYPTKSESGTLQRVGARTFLVFTGEPFRVVEIADRAKDHLAVWFRGGVSREANIEAQLRALPATTRAPDLELVLVPEPKPGNRPAPSARLGV